MRDRLIELLKNNSHLDVLFGDEWEEAAEELLANGVIVSPCYIGQDVWHITEHYDGRIELGKGKISMLQQKADKSWKIRITVNSSVWDFTPDEIGKRYFLTKEEAEAVLAERSGE
jgi:hypothetical protein